MREAVSSPLASRPPERAQELRARRRELELRLDPLAEGGREGDLGVGEVEQAPDAGLVPALAEREPLPHGVRGLHRRAERRDRGADAEPRLLELEPDLLRELLRLRVERGRVGARLAHLPARLAALEERPAQRHLRVPAGGEVVRLPPGLRETGLDAEARAVAALERADRQLLAPELLPQGGELGPGRDRLGEEHRGRGVLAGDRRERRVGDVPRAEVGHADRLLDLDARGRVGVVGLDQPDARVREVDPLLHEVDGRARADLDEGAGLLEVLLLVRERFARDGEERLVGDRVEVGGPDGERDRLGGTVLGVGLAGGDRLRRTPAPGGLPEVPDEQPAGEPGAVELAGPGRREEAGARERRGRRGARSLVARRARDLWQERRERLVDARARRLGRGLGLAELRLAREAEPERLVEAEDAGGVGAWRAGRGGGRSRGGWRLRGGARREQDESERE